MLVSAVFTLLMAAILIRVIGSWLGIGPYRKWMRPVYALTDWLIEPDPADPAAGGDVRFQPDGGLAGAVRGAGIRAGDVVDGCEVPRPLSPETLLAQTSS